jgi:hypothetical protein
MSKRSIYLRDQAQKCEWHARQMTAHDIISELRRLAADYLTEADEIERGEMSSTNRPSMPEGTIPSG